MRLVYRIVVDCSFGALPVAIVFLLATSSSSINQSSNLFRNSYALSIIGTQTVQQVSGGGRTAKVAMRPASKVIAVTGIRNLGEETWLERLEIEVTNMSDQPVPFLLMLVVFPDLNRKREDGVVASQTLVLMYGRMDLVYKESFANRDDVAINPGQRYVFRIPEKDRKVLEAELASGIISESALKRMLIMVDTVNFGNGTGFRSGLPYPSTTHPDIVKKSR